jgi:hypothetical protein
MARPGVLLTTANVDNRQRGAEMIPTWVNVLWAIGNFLAFVRIGWTIRDIQMTRKARKAREKALHPPPGE